MDDERVLEVRGDFGRVVGGKAVIGGRADVHHDVARAVLGDEEIADLQRVLKLIVGGHFLPLAVAVYVIIPVFAVFKDHRLKRGMLFAPRDRIDPARIAGAIEAVNVPGILAVKLGVFPALARGVQQIVSIAAEKVRHAVFKRGFHVGAGDLVVAREEDIAFLDQREGGVEVLAPFKLGRGDGRQCHQAQDDRKKPFHGVSSVRSFVRSP